MKTTIYVAGFADIGDRMTLFDEFKRGGDGDEYPELYHLALPKVKVFGSLDCPEIERWLKRIRRTHFDRRSFNVTKWKKIPVSNSRGIKRAWALYDKREGDDKEVMVVVLRAVRVR